MNSAARFFSLIDANSKADILAAIANHYGITPEAAEQEVTAPGAENLLDYLTGSTRAATHVLMQRHGIA